MRSLRRLIFVGGNYMKRYDDKWGIFLFIFYKYMSDIVFFSKMKKKKDFCLV